jgi:hypothetical protein
MTPSLNERAYKVISEFLDAINSMDEQALESRFGVTEPILEEICESFDDYFGGKLNVGLPSIEVTFSGKKESRPYIDIFEMDDGQSWGVECFLWVDGQVQESILHAELHDKGDDLKLKYKYIGS